LIGREGKDNQSYGGDCISKVDNCVGLVHHSSNSSINQLNDLNIPELYLVWLVNFSRLIKLNRPQCRGGSTGHDCLMHVPVATTIGDDDDDL